MKTDPTPLALVIQNAVQFGVFDGVPGAVNLRQLRGGPTAFLRFKTWQHLLINTPGHRFTLAMIDLGYIKTGWLRHIPAHGDSFETTALGPLLPCQIADDLRGSATSFFRATGLQIEISHENPRRHFLRVNSERVQLALELSGDSISPLAVCLPLGKKDVMYSQKMPLVASGQITIDGVSNEVSPERGHALIDVHQAYYPHKTNWRWATASWRDAEHGLCAFNLTHNQAREPHHYNECALWLGDRLYRLPLAEFTIGEDPLAPWHIVSQDRSIELRFEPEGMRSDDTRIGPLKSWYLQPWGRFSGWIKTPCGQRIMIDAFGLCEDHQARW
jgi:hypothetical protein